MLSETLQAQIDEIDSKMDRVKALAKAELEVLAKRKAILLKAASLLTPEIEASFNALKDLGVIK